MILEARWPDGGIQAQWINPTPQQEASFRATMIRQGCAVQAFDDSEYLAFLESRRTELTAKRAQVAAVLSIQDAGPAIGAEIVHETLGWATVTHIVTLEGQPLPVATGPRGQGLVRPGQWRVATEVDRPFWKRGDVNTSTCVQLDNPTTLPAPPAQPRKASIMPSLF